MVFVDNVEKLKDSLLKLKEIDLIACDTESTDLDFKKAKLQGIGYGTDEQTFFIPFPNIIPKDEILKALNELFKKRVIFHNAKYDLQVFANKDLPTPERIHDTMIMSWLIDENGSHKLKQLARDILGKEPKTWLELKKEPDLFQTEEDITQELAEYCCDDVSNTYLLFKHLLPTLKKEGFEKDYEKVELPIIHILCAMELRGVRVDVAFLEERHEVAKKELEALEESITEEIKAKDPDRQINLRSPQQLESILFDLFGYKSEKKTDGGARATDAETLKEIVDDNKLSDKDFLPKLLKFRELDKLDGTYFVALAKQAGLENVIHTNFFQHGTATGRFSSSNPNLQNIPSRSDEWNVRRAFIPREGYKFVMADYSQLELRLLAHFSQDKVMLKTFNEGGDIHAETMKAINSNRHHAKTTNFGICYGMGPRSLAQGLHIKEVDAKDYIDKFFAKYKGVKVFIENTQIRALKEGSVRMITGRKRHFAEIADKKWWNQIARQAVNTMVQGSASDLVKVAMRNLYPKLKALDSHLLIQIHDEVIVETPIGKIEEVKHIVKETMESALKFTVPLVVNVTEGDRWLKE